VAVIRSGKGAEVQLEARASVRSHNPQQGQATVFFPIMFDGVAAQGTAIDQNE
jgi:hypothetical protein